MASLDNWKASSGTWKAYLGYNQHIFGYNEGIWWVLGRHLRIPGRHLGIPGMHRRVPATPTCHQHHHITHTTIPQRHCLPRPHTTNTTYCPHHHTITKTTTSTNQDQNMKKKISSPPKSTDKVSEAKLLFSFLVKMEMQPWRWWSLGKRRINY